MIDLVSHGERLILSLSFIGPLLEIQTTYYNDRCQSFSKYCFLVQWDCLAMLLVHLIKPMCLNVVTATLDSFSSVLNVTSFAYQSVVCFSAASCVVCASD